MTKITYSPKKAAINSGDSFSTFFHTASKKMKTAVFIKAAEKANKDQRNLVKHANLKLKGV